MGIGDGLSVSSSRSFIESIIVLWKIGLASTGVFGVSSTHISDWAFSSRGCFYTLLFDLLELGRYSKIGLLIYDFYFRIIDFCTWVKFAGGLGRSFGI